MLKPKIETQNLYKVAKRIAITIVICIPFLFAFAYLTRKTITSNALQIFLFVLIMGFAVLLEEIITRRIEKRKKQAEIENNNTDVFK